MTYNGALVMPSSYAVMNEEEMTYVEGGGLGKHWYNSTGFIGGAIEGLLYLVPVLAAVSKATKLGKGLSAAMKLVGISKEALISGLTKIGQKVCSKITKSAVSKAIGFVWTVGGMSLGGIIATGLDYADGCKDGYIFA